MSLTQEQQIQELLRRSENILILLPVFAPGDALAAATGLTLFLEQGGKTVTLAGAHLNALKERLGFLPPVSKTLESLSGSRDFMLSFNTRHNKILAVRTEENAEEYRVYITPEHGAIDPRDFSFIPAQFKFDAVITIGAHDKESIGPIYEQNPDIFYEIPVLNIDCHPRNENFGQINLVDMTASSLSEIVAQMIEHLDPGLPSDAMAESLLTGIIAATESFQKKNTTPKALQIASHLMDRGADQQKIVRHLYKTQPFHLLKLWGRVMAGLKWHEGTRLAWSLVTPEDLVQARASTQDLPLILEKIRSHYSAGQFFLLLWPENHQSVKGILKAHHTDALTPLAALWEGSHIQEDVLEFSLPVSDLATAEKMALETLLPVLLKK